MPSDVAVVILNWNGSSMLKSYLPTIIKYSDGARIIVADNGSTDDSCSIITTIFNSVTLIRLDKNYGFSGGYNRALKQVSAKYYLLLNSDVLVTENWIEPLRNILESDSTIAAVQPKILSLTDRNSFEHAGASGGFIDRFGFAFCRGRMGSTIEKDLGQYNDRCDIFWSSGAAMLIRSDIYNSLGGFDDDFFAHMEEIDLAWRIHSSGYRIVVEPKSTVYHLGGGSLSYESPMKLYLNFRNSLFMLYKNLPTKIIFPTFIVKMSADGVIALGYLISGRSSLFMSVLKAHIAFYKNLPTLRQKRTLTKHTLPDEVYKGSVILKYLFVRKTYK